ncbi:hypothetical protein JTB14_033172 [Gonioctena quinquepunctata]|nr:hypothetical protein JTB14_033172 [Gonioctena quinquepunctata]
MLLLAKGFVTGKTQKQALGLTKILIFIKLIHLKARAVAQGRVDQHLIKHLDEEILHWKKNVYLPSNCQVLQYISNEVQSAKYFDIIVDSTSGTCRSAYISNSYVRENGEIVEQFLEFIPNTGHKVSKDEKPSTRREAIGVQRKLQHLETGILVIVWNLISDHFNAASKKLQNSQVDLTSVFQMYGSLAPFLQDMRDKQFSEYEEKAKALSGVQDY